MDSRDKRTKRQKLQDMANQSASPREAEIAKQKLAELGPQKHEEKITYKQAAIAFNGRPNIVFPSGTVVTETFDPLTFTWTFTWDEE